MHVLNVTSCFKLLCGQKQVCQNNNVYEDLWMTSKPPQSSRCNENTRACESTIFVVVVAVIITTQRQDDRHRKLVGCSLSRPLGLLAQRRSDRHSTTIGDTRALTSKRAASIEKRKKLELEMAVAAGWS